jgi:hypothetical protein
VIDRRHIASVVYSSTVVYVLPSLSQLQKAAKNAEGKAARIVHEVHRRGEIRGDQLTDEVSGRLKAAASAAVKRQRARFRQTSAITGYAEIN